MVQPTQQQLLLVVLGGLLPWSGSAFSGQRSLQGSILARSGAHHSQSVRNPKRVVLSSDPRGLLLEDEPFAKKPKATTMAGPDDMTGGETLADYGKELFLANIENSTPDTLLAEPAVAVESGTSMGSAMGVLEDDAEATKDFSPPEEGVFGFTLDNSTTTTTATTKSVAELGQEINQQANRNVEAVLAASEDAMIAAEASLPLEVKKELRSFGGTNNTDTISSAPTSTTTEEFVDIVPAEEVVGEAVTKTKIEAPHVMKILKFAIPAVGVWLCSPMLSLIDTSAVGVLSGTTQQAALNPAVAVTDYAALLIAFLYTATTNLVASAEESDRTLPGKPKTTSAMIGAMQLSTYVGVGLGAALFIFAKQLLRAIIGNDAINPAVFAAAMKYVRIRALGMPAAAIIGSAQAGCLGCKDIKSPLYVLLAAAIVNFFGDVMFVGCKHPLIGGAAGAAWATVFSQYAALALFVRWLVKKPKTGDKGPKVLDLTKNIMDFMSKKASNNGGKRSNNNAETALQSNEVQLQEKAKAKGGKVKGLFGQLQKSNSNASETAKSKEETPSVRGMLAGRFRGRDLLKLPAKEIAKDFAPYVAPVTVTQIGRVSGYVAMSHVVSSSLGTISMAAQQVIVSFFYCLTPIADSLSLTAQSFIPGISERKPSIERAMALRKTGRNFMKAGGVFGGVMAAAIGLLPIMSGFFTADPAVVSLVNMVVPLLVAFFSVHGVLCASEGVLLGQKDLGFLGKMYGAYFFAVPYFMLRVKRAALSGAHAINLSNVWTVFLGYQMFRLLAWVVRVELIQKVTDRAAAALHDLKP